jgi:hypothetical protein
MGVNELEIRNCDCVAAALGTINEVVLIYIIEPVSDPTRPN